MKILYNFFARLFGVKQLARVAGNSQPYVLQAKIRDAGISHGSTFLADLTEVELRPGKYAPVLYFCPMKDLTDVIVVKEGDGGKIPREVKLRGLKVDPIGRGGVYNLKNVEITSNGAIHLKATSKTTWEKVKSFS